MRRIVLIASVLAFVAATAAGDPCPSLTPYQNVDFSFHASQSACFANPFGQQPCYQGEQIRFRALAWDFSFDCGPHEFIWHFGDGTTETGREVTHVYPRVGWFIVTLIGRTPAQAVQVSHMVVTDPVPLCPTINPAKVAVFYAGLDSECGPLSGNACTAREPIAFSTKFFEYDLRCDEHEFTWHFGDGTTASGRYVTHAYSRPGDYYVTTHIRSGDHSGHGDDWRHFVRVERFVSIAAAAQPLRPFSVQPSRYRAPGKHIRAFEFWIRDAVGAGDWIWDFGDGVRRQGTQPLVDHTYKSPGTYTVTLSSTLVAAKYQQTVIVERAPPPLTRRRSIRH